MLQYNFLFNFVVDSTNLLIYILGHYQFIYYVCMLFSMLIPWHTCGGQKRTCECQFSLYMYVLGIIHDKAQISALSTALYSLPHLIGPYLFPCYFYQKKRRFLVLSCYESFPIGIFILFLQTGSQHAMTCLTISHSNIQHMAV